MVLDATVVIVTTVPATSWLNLFHKPQFMVDAEKSFTLFEQPEKN